jgi:membrane dipeptidase
MRLARPQSAHSIFFPLPIALLTMVTPLVAQTPASSDAHDPHMERALRVLATTPLIDGHNDLPWQIRIHPDHPMDVATYGIAGRQGGHTDIPRLRQGRVGGQLWSVYVPSSAMETGAARFQLEQIDVALQIIEQFPEHLELALTAEDLVRIFHAGKIGSILAMEGGHAIENSLGALRAFYALGVRAMTLTHSAQLDWADASPADQQRLGGLSPFGVEVVREMNRLGMLVDISHVSDGTMSAVLDVSEAPVFFSHSSVRALRDHHRNVPDSILTRLPENGGLIMVTFVPGFLVDPARGTPAELADVADHLDHVKRLIGVDYVGLGGDYDGIETVPVGLEDVSTYPALLAELSRRGWTEAELRKLVGENFLRVMRDAEAAARRLQMERPPSTATLEEMDGLSRGR